MSHIVRTGAVTDVGQSEMSLDAGSADTPKRAVPLSG